MRLAMPYLLLSRVDDGQVTSLALTVALALTPSLSLPGDEVTAAAEELPAHWAHDRGQRCSWSWFDHRRNCSAGHIRQEFNAKYTYRKNTFAQ